MRTKIRKVRVACTLDADLLAWLEHESAETRHSISGIINAMIAKEMKDALGTNAEQGSTLARTP